jgi:hypothetical protein
MNLATQGVEIVCSIHTSVNSDYAPLKVPAHTCQAVNVGDEEVRIVPYLDIVYFPLNRVSQRFCYKSPTERSV